MSALGVRGHLSSSATGAVFATCSGVTSASALLGVAVGGLLTARVQKRQWARSQQIEACAVIVVESTRVQLSLRGQWKHDHHVDWVPWNEALAKISLV